MGGDPSPPVANATPAIPVGGVEENEEDKVDDSVSFLGGCSTSSQLDEKSFEQDGGSSNSKEEEEEDAVAKRRHSLDIMREQVEQLRPATNGDHEESQLETPSTREEQIDVAERMVTPPPAPIRSLVIRQDIQERTAEANCRNISEDKLAGEEEMEDEEELRIDEEMEEGGE
jgi:hypothetical protein